MKNICIKKSISGCRTPLKEHGLHTQMWARKQYQHHQHIILSNKVAHQNRSTLITFIWGNIIDPLSFVIYATSAKTFVICQHLRNTEDIFKIHVHV